MLGEVPALSSSGIRGTVPLREVSHLVLELFIKGRSPSSTACLPQEVVGGQTLRLPFDGQRN